MVVMLLEQLSAFLCAVSPWLSGNEGYLFRWDCVEYNLTLQDAR